MNHIEFMNAINRLVPYAKVTLIDDKIIWEDDRKQPTIEEIEENIKNFSYYNNRKKSYPSIEDQLDIMYHSGYDSWKQVIKEVKEKYPKPQ